MATLLWLVLMTVVVGIPGVLSSVPVFFWIFMCGSASEIKTPAKVIVAITSLPIVCIYGIYSAWSYYFAENYAIFVYLVLITLVLGILLVGSALAAGFSIMMFDSPGAIKNPVTVFLFLAITALPIVCCCAIVCSWSSYFAGNYSTAWRITFLPFVNLAVVRLGWWCLNTFYGGRFDV